MPEPLTVANQLPSQGFHEYEPDPPLVDPRSAKIAETQRKNWARRRAQQQASVEMAMWIQRAAPIVRAAADAGDVTSQELVEQLAEGR